MLQQGDRLNQLRLRKGNPVLTDDARKALHAQTPLLYQDGVPLLSNPQWISIDTQGNPNEKNPIVGYRAKRHTLPINLRNVGTYNWHHFWEPITRADCDPLILYPEDFYIFASCEGVYVPPEYAAELVAYDTRVGEIRVHYAGFFDPGWGINGKGNPQGTRAVLEVRAHDVPCVLEHGQPIGRFLYEKLLHAPAAMYGAGIGSNYAGQGLKLAKQFNMAA
jgi:dCTP deaminase